ncbi:jg1459, partial [Pararge aegeria aegeria]
MEKELQKRIEEILEPGG